MIFSTFFFVVYDNDCPFVHTDNRSVQDICKGKWLPCPSFVTCFISLARPQSLKLQILQQLLIKEIQGFFAAFKESFEVSTGLKSGLDFLNPLPG